MYKQSFESIDQVGQYYVSSLDYLVYD